MSNVQLFTIQDLLDPSGEVPAMHLFVPRATWQTVQAMVKENQFPKSKEDAFKALNSFARWRYAVVVRPRSFSESQIASEPRETKTTDRETYSVGTFTPGMIDGDALLYDLSDLSFLGGFPFTAKS